MKLVVELKNAALKSDVYTLRCAPGVYPGAAFQHFWQVPELSGIALHFFLKNPLAFHAYPV